MPKIYTKTGDEGHSRLSDMTSVSKSDLRIHCLGDIDEVNASIGVLRSTLTLEHHWQNQLKRIQTELMNCMAHIAFPSQSSKKCTLPLPTESTAWVESWIDKIEANATEPSKYFLLPAGDATAAWCHMVRTQMRRAERSLISLHENHPVEASILAYINRLSDLFFMLSREALQSSGIPEEKWVHFRYDPSQPS